MAVELKSGIRIIMTDRATGKKKEAYHDNYLTNSGISLIFKKLRNIDGFGAGEFATHIAVGIGPVDSEGNPTLDVNSRVYTQLRAGTGFTDSAPVVAQDTITNPTVSSGRLRMPVNFANNEAVFTWREVGLFRRISGTPDIMVARSILNPPQVKSNSVSAEAVWEMSFGGNS